jgi:hypothetical protein
MTFVGGGSMLPWWKVRDVLLELVQAKSSEIQIHLGMSIDTVTEQEDGSYVATCMVMLKNTGYLSPTTIHLNLFR